MEAKDLAAILRHAYVELRPQKLDLKYYSKSSLIGFRSAIHRHVQDLKRPFNILQDIEFNDANRALLAFLRKIQKEGDLKAVQHKQPINDEDMKKPTNYFAQYSTDAVVLTEMVWFTVTMHFCLRGREAQWKLCAEDFEVASSPKGDYMYVKMKTAHIEKNHQGGFSPEEVSDGRIVDQQQVDAFKLLLEKLPRNPTGKSRLFQQTRKRYVPTDDKWFNGKPLGKNTLASMMKRLHDKCELSQTLTNHSVRETAITNLFRQGLPTSTVMGVSRHRSAASLSSYIQPTEAEKLKNAALLDLDLPKKRLRERDEEDEDAEEIDQILSHATASDSELKSLEKTTVMKGTFNKCKIENHFHVTVVKK